MSFFDNAIDYFKRLILIKYVPSINKRLKQLKTEIDNIEMLVSEVNRSYSLFPDQYMGNIKKEQGKIHNYVKNGNVFSFDKKLERIMYQITEEKRPFIFKRFEDSYKEMGERYLSGISNLEETVQRVNEKLEPYYTGIEMFNKEVEGIKNRYISHSVFIKVKSKYQHITIFFKDHKDVNEAVLGFFELYYAFNELVREWNQEFVKQEMRVLNDYFSNIDGKSLDDQQREAVVKDEDANLVVAGAGSGKTLTISGKVKYLVERKGILPEEILLVSFTRKAADEMEERIKKRLNINVDVNTFHKIGINIISKHTRIKPDVADNAEKIIKEYFDKEMYDDPRQLKRMIEYFGYYLNVPIDLEEFINLGEAYDYQKNMDFETLKSKYDEQTFTEQKSEELKKSQTTLIGEKVKSLEEVMIANFLFLNGVEYVYEREYQYSTGSEHFRKYKPDFYLPEYGIYLEHFGITKDERTPWLSEIEEKKYIEGMRWKRELHRENGTELVETFSYLTGEGKLLEVLRNKLLEKGVKYKEVDFIEVFNKIYDTENTNHFAQFIYFISSFINLFKSNGYEYEKFDEIQNSLDKKNIFLYNRTRIFLEITKPVYTFYQNKLKENKMIDFNDMINDATSIVTSKQMEFSYKYIIIDEYQDISVSRFKLIQAIRNNTNAKVMAVGDDWQSIFRFAGSDLNLFTEFKNYFGHSEMLKIEKTYRNSQELINYAGNFVMKNKKQIKKNLKSDKEHTNPIRMLGYIGPNEILRTLKHAIEEIVKNYGEQADIMLLGRNNFDINFVEKDSEFKIKKNKEGTNVIYNNYPKLKMFYLTAHKSKGLEADNVIIINASKKVTGFPNRMSDDPILSLVLTEQDEFLFAEERRLFYVALTRTRNETYILVPDINMSSFVKEIKDFPGIQYEIIDGNTVLSNNPRCPRCIEGYLIHRENNSSKESFLGCSSYPQCEYSLKDITVLDNPVKCSRCEGYMVRRKGKNGEFYGCSNYPDCRNTINSKDEI
ncbi:UvrD-helicase domain-containing protein [Peribacillus frigoritolerans]|uniref:UvrD-helicase domain-containing protein n=1 Tax=Peribacillus frigoritolerans TaxID=450367 RepID=UPI003D26CACC